MKTATLLVLVLPVVALIVWLAPLALVWALNILFALALPYTLKTWAAALILGGIVSLRATK